MTHCHPQSDSIHFINHLNINVIPSRHRFFFIEISLNILLPVKDLSTVTLNTFELFLLQALIPVLLSCIGSLAHHVSSLDTGYFMLPIPMFDIGLAIKCIFKFLSSLKVTEAIELQRYNGTSCLLIMKEFIQKKLKPFQTLK